MHRNALLAGFDVEHVFVSNEDPTKAVAKGVWGATIKGNDGAPLDGCSFVMPWVQLWTVVDAKVTRYEYVPDMSRSHARTSKLGNV